MDESASPANCSGYEEEYKTAFTVFGAYRKCNHYGLCQCTGTAIPPIVKFKGNRLKPELFNNLPPRSLVNISTKRYTTNERYKKLSFDIWWSCLSFRCVYRWSHRFTWHIFILFTIEYRPRISAPRRDRLLIISTPLKWWSYVILRTK